MLRLKIEEPNTYTSLSLSEDGTFATLGYFHVTEGGVSEQDEQ